MDDKKTAEDIVAKAIIIALTREGPSVARTDTKTLRDDIATAIAAEREACAKIAEADDSFMMLQDFGMQSTVTQVRINIASAIRARGNKQ